MMWLLIGLYNIYSESYLSMPKEGLGIRLDRRYTTSRVSNTMASGVWRLVSCVLCLCLVSVTVSVYMSKSQGPN